MRAINFEQDFATTLRQGKRIDIFLAYGSTQRRGLEAVLREIAGKKTTIVNLVLPNPDNVELMTALKNRFSKPNPQIMKDEIETAKKEWLDFFSQKQGKINIYYTDIEPTYSYYRIDKYTVVAIYKHKKGRGNVPHFEINTEGELGRYFADEFAYIKDQASPVSQSQQAKPSRGNKQNEERKRSKPRSI